MVPRGVWCPRFPPFSRHDYAALSYSSNLRGFTRLEKETRAAVGTNKDESGVEAPLGAEIAISARLATHIPTLIDAVIVVFVYDESLRARSP